MNEIVRFIIKSIMGCAAAARKQIRWCLKWPDCLSELVRGGGKNGKGGQWL